jgi:hypothetical protein
MLFLEFYLMKEQNEVKPVKVNLQKERRVFR